MENQQCIVNIIDTAWQQEYTSLRDQHLSSRDGFLLVFVLNEKSTFEEILKLRQSNLNLKDDSKVPFVLVGNKSDLSLRDITKQPINAIIQKYNITYIETCAKENKNFSEAYEELVKITRTHKAKSKCTIL